MSEVVFEAERRADGLSAAVAVIIALATLVAAMVGFLQAEASGAAGNRRFAAEQLSLQSLAGGQTAQQRAQVHYANYMRGVEQRTLASNALLRSLYEETGSAEESALLAEQERWERLADGTARLTEISPDGEFGPQNDPAFPARYFASAGYEALRLNALQDAANEEALRLDERGANLTAILAMLAVSLYLLGLTLAVRERVLQLGFLAVGVALLLVASAWTLLTVLQPIPTSEPEAASAYARGRVAVETSFSSAGHAEGVRHFDRAIELRPTFARAYAERAHATFLAATPQRTGFASIVPPEALRSARADLEQARQLGLESGSIFGALGFYTFVDGTQAGDRALLGQSVDFSRRAAELDPQEPIYRFNLGVTLLAAGRQAEAEAAYDEAVARALYVDEEREELRGEPFVEAAWLAGALTDLEIVVTHQPERADEIRRIKERIVGPMSAGTLESLPSSPAVFTDLELTIFPAEAQWQGTLQGYDAERDYVSAQWYHRDADGLGWAVIPEISRRATPGVGSAGRHFQLSSYIDVVLPAACLPPGSYRAEIYVNGRLAGLGETTADFQATEAYAARDLALALCRPADWQPLDDSLTGVLGGFTEPAGERGTYAMHYPLPRSFALLEDVSALVIDITLESFGDDFPGVPVYMEEEGTSASYFMGLERTAWRWYDYGTGYVRAAAGLNDDGAVMVGLVWGPYDWFESEEPFEIMNSFVPYR